MGLRLREGIPADRYAQLGGRALDQGRLAFLREQAMIEPAGDGRVRATRDGWLVLDSVVSSLAA
jgi:oxygen-independent coproporphyrinogen-3 oxidase